MNISMLPARTVLKWSGVAALLALAFGVAFIAYAAVSITTATLDASVVAPGTSVTVNVEANKTGGGCDNNWNITRVTVDGNTFESSLGSITGAGVVNDSVVFDAPTTPGTYEVLVELIGGGEAFDNTVCDDAQVWDSETLSLDVVVDPFIELLSISPLDEVRPLGDTNPLVYVAEVEVGGDPVSGHLQCVIFDIFKGDGWQTVSVDYNTPGTYLVELPYDISDPVEYPVGTYDVIAIASSENCTDATDGDFDTLGYDEDGLYAMTTLTIEEPTPDADRFTLTVTINGEGGDGEGNVQTDGEVEDPIACFSEGEEQDCSGTYPEGTEVTIVATANEGSNFDSSWSGACTGNNPVCVVVMTANQSVNAHFALNSSDSSSSGGGGGGGGSRRNNDDDDDDDSSSSSDGEVLGEQITVVPVGAPNAGHGGSAAQTFTFAQILGMGTPRKGVFNVR